MDMVVRFLFRIRGRWGDLVCHLRGSRWFWRGWDPVRSWLGGANRASRAAIGEAFGKEAANAVEVSITAMRVAVDSGRVVIGDGYAFILGLGAVGWTVMRHGGVGRCRSGWSWEVVSRGGGENGKWEGGRGMQDRLGGPCFEFDRVNLIV